MSQIEYGFWSELKKRSPSIVGLSPMDGVTDAPFRFIVQKYGQPDVTFTEFVNVEGLSRGAVRLLEHFQYDDSERPIVAQVYGTDPAAFRVAAQIVCALGFDGLDINMGCPAKKVAHRGAGAGLIRTPEVAAEIIAACQAGVADWVAGLKLEDIAMVNAAKARRLIAEHRDKLGLADDQPRRAIPVSVKTRLGYDRSVIGEWAAFLADQPIAALTIHGRTLKQLYTGQANWDELAVGFAAARAKRPDLVLLGNGDVANRAAADQLSRQAGADGALIGRATLGNPWVFTNHEPSVEQRIELAIEHARLVEAWRPAEAFSSFRRHLAAYVKGLPGAAHLRNELMQATNASEVEALLRPFLANG